jgi:hypothetical protein
MMSINLKREFLSLLEKDVEFRYAVAGYLGLSEILKKMDALIEEQHKLWENQNKLWENQNKLWEEVRSLREDQHRLWENQNKLWEEVRALREGQNKLWEEVKALREGQNKLWEEVKSLRVSQSRLEVSMGSLGRRLGKGMEKMILNIYKDQLMQIGVNPDKAKRFKYIDEEGRFGRKGKEYEFDIVVSDEHTDVLEVKAHTEKEDVEWFYENVESIKTLFDKPLRRKIIVTVNIDDDALIKANELGINVIYGNVIKE